MTPEAVVRGFVTLFLEVEAGMRPLRALRPLVDADLYMHLLASPCRSVPAFRPPRVVSLSWQLSGRMLRAGVVVERDGGFGAVAVALRLRENGRWCAVEAYRPDMPPPPLRRDVLVARAVRLLADALDDRHAQAVVARRHRSRKTTAAKAA